MIHDEADALETCTTTRTHHVAEYWSIWDFHWDIGVLPSALLDADISA